MLGSTKKAAQGAVALHSAKYRSDGARKDGLAAHYARRMAARHAYGRRRANGRGFGAGGAPANCCARAEASDNMASARRLTGCELGSLLHSSRRMTAAPFAAFSFGGVRTHGLIAPALRSVCGLMPCGKPSGLPLPTTRSANPHGVAHLLAGVSGFHQFVVGACHE